MPLARRNYFSTLAMVPTETDFACAMERPRDVVQEIYGTWRT